MGDVSRFSVRAALSIMLGPGKFTTLKASRDSRPFGEQVEELREQWMAMASDERMRAAIACGVPYLARD